MAFRNSIATQRRDETSAEISNKSQFESETTHIGLTSNKNATIIVKMAQLIKPGVGSI